MSESNSTRQLSAENSPCYHEIGRRIINGQRGLSPNRHKIEQKRLLRTGFKLSIPLTHGPANCTVRSTFTNTKCSQLYSL